MPTDPNTLSLPDLYEHLAGTGLTRRLLELARDEDLGPDQRDITAELVAEAPETTAAVRCRKQAVVAGLACIPELFDVFGAEVEADMLAADGETLHAGDDVLTLRGPLTEIVRVERTLLNLLGRLSGIATRVRDFASRIPEGCTLLDTRKTTPGLRALEKYAVRCGGGALHRLGLHDAVLIKDNHIAHLSERALSDFASRAAEAGRLQNAAFVEIEVDTLPQLRAVLAAQTPVDIVLLDNMTTDELRQAVEIRNQVAAGVKLEASGGISLDAIADVAATGIERVSVGSLTHQARSIDFGLDIDRSPSPAEPRSGESELSA
ncbi:MAG: carboxylating nicotinate-nucleotide diphosphorylase [Planctomycetota bacterium]